MLEDVTMPTVSVKTKRKAKKLETARQVLNQKIYQNSSVADDVSSLNRTSLSREAVEELRHDERSEDGSDSFISALRQVFERKLDEKGTSQKAREKNPKVKRKMEWKPKTRAGQIHPGRDVVGGLVIKDVADHGSVEAPKKPEEPKADKSKPKRNKEKPKLTAQSEQAAAKMKKTGVEPPKELKDAKSQAGAQQQEGEKIVFDGDLRSRATGFHQIVSVTPGGEVPLNDPLGYFQKLDDKPVLANSTLHGKDGKEFIQDHRRRREAGEQVAPLDDDLKQKLLHPREN